MLPQSKDVRCKSAMRCIGWNSSCKDREHLKAYVPDKISGGWKYMFSTVKCPCQRHECIWEDLRGVAPLNLGTRWTAVNFPLLPLYSQYQLNGRLGGPRGGLNVLEE
jgi:hypothetical protein